MKLDKLTNKFIHPRLQKFYLKKFKTTQSKPFSSACFQNGVQKAGILQKKETEMLVLFCKKNKKKVSKKFWNFKNHLWNDVQEAETYKRKKQNVNKQTFC